MRNPFLEQSADLFFLDTRTIADASVIATVRQIEAAGKRQLHIYFEECLTAEQRNMYEPIKKNNLLSYLAVRLQRFLPRTSNR